MFTMFNPLKHGTSRPSLVRRSSPIAFFLRKTLRNFAGDTHSAQAAPIRRCGELHPVDVEAIEVVIAVLELPKTICFAQRGLHMSTVHGHSDSDLITGSWSCLERLEVVVNNASLFEDGPAMSNHGLRNTTILDRQRTAAAAASFVMCSDTQ